MPDPNLAARHAQLFDLQFHSRIGRDAIKKLRLDQGQKGRRPIFFANEYEADGEKCSASAVGFPIKRRPDVLHVSITYTLGQRGTTLDGEKPVQELIESLHEANAVLDEDVRCTVLFEYSDKEWISAVTLPTSMFNLPGLAFDEIRGLRLVKKAEKKKTKFAIIVDRPENKGYTHTVLFSSDAAISPDIIGNLLAEASNISRQFIFKGENGD